MDKPRLTKKRGPQIDPRIGFSVPQAGAMAGKARGSSYRMAANGEMPVIDVGGHKIVPRVPWLKKLGVEDLDSFEPGDAAQRVVDRLPPESSGADIRDHSIKMRRELNRRREGGER
jgi:hypothetical protein